jgi:histidinol phosphatase-like PHP family hydrolase
MSISLSTVEPESRIPLVDYHIHTTYSDGYNTIDQYVEAAEMHGLEEIAFTDHVWRSSEWVPDYIADIEDARQKTDVVLYAGAEAKIIDDSGCVDIVPEDAEMLDFVMGVVHRYQPNNDPPKDDMLNFDPLEAAEREYNLTRSLMENDLVDIIGHPSRTYYKFFYGERSTEPYPSVCYEAMIEDSRRTGTPLEYNARLPPCVRERQLKLYADAEVSFTLGSDSHYVDRLEDLNHGRIQNRLR